MPGLYAAAMDMITRIEPPVIQAQKAWVLQMDGTVETRKTRMAISRPLRLGFFT